jgi:hypothetical protein
LDVIKINKKYVIHVDSVPSSMYFLVPKLLYFFTCSGLAKPGVKELKHLNHHILMISYPQNRY